MLMKITAAHVKIYVSFANRYLLRANIGYLNIVLIIYDGNNERRLTFFTNVSSARGGISNAEKPYCARFCMQSFLFFDSR